MGYLQFESDTWWLRAKSDSPLAHFLIQGTGVGGITVPSINHLWSPVWRLSTCLESGIIYNILFNMQNPSKLLLKLQLGNSKVLQLSSQTPLKILLHLPLTTVIFLPPYSLLTPIPTTHQSL